MLPALSVRYNNKNSLIALINVMKQLVHALIITITKLLNLIALISAFILPHEEFLQFDLLRAVVFQLNLKYLHVKITNLLWVVV